MFDEYDYQQLMGDSSYDDEEDNSEYHLDHGGGGDGCADVGCLLILAIIIGVIYYSCK